MKKTKKKKKKAKRILIVDGNNLVARNVHAMPNLATKSGIPTGGLKGSLGSLLMLLTEFMHKRVAGIVICQDAGIPAFRFDAYPEYKGNRVSVDELLAKKRLTKKEKDHVNMRQLMADQNKRLPGFMLPLGVAFARAPGYEADDLAAYFVKHVFADKKIVLFSGDRDWTQLVEKKRVHHFVPAKNETITKRTDGLQIIRAMVGDISDNIKGVPGIGPKKAEELFDEFPITKPKKFVKAVCAEDTSKGPAKLLAANTKAFLASYKAADLTLSAKKLAETGRVQVRCQDFDADEFRQLCRKLEMFKFLMVFDDNAAPFASAWYQGRKKGVFERLSAL